MVQGEPCRSCVEIGRARVASCVVSVPDDAETVRASVGASASSAVVSVGRVGRPSSVGASIRVRAGEVEPAWAYSVIALRWAAKYYAAEREFALQMIEDIDAADAVIANAAKGGAGKPRPVPGYWREVERQIESKRKD